MRRAAIIHDRRDADRHLEISEWQKGNGALFTIREGGSERNIWVTSEDFAAIVQHLLDFEIDPTAS